MEYWDLSKEETEGWEIKQRVVPYFVISATIHTVLCWVLLWEWKKILFNIGDITDVQPLSNVCVISILCSSPNSIGILKSRWMRHAGSLYVVEKVTNAYKF
jgi:hypothetical protein